MEESTRKAGAREERRGRGEKKQKSEGEEQVQGRSWLLSPLGSSREDVVFPSFVWGSFTLI